MSVDSYSMHLYKCLDENTCQVRTFDEFYTFFFNIINKSYDNFINETFGPDLLKFLTSKYKNNYVWTLHLFFIEFLPFIRLDNCRNNLLEITRDTSLKIPVPSVHRSSCDTVFGNKFDCIIETMDKLIELWRVYSF